MEDDITNAMNSLDASATDIGSVPPAQNVPPVADTTNMPPIFRPEDVNTTVEPSVAAMPEEIQVAPTNEPEPMPEVNLEQPVQPEPMAPEQTYAPMPQLAAVEPPMPEPGPVIPPVSTMPISVNPAMVEDPLYPSKKPEAQQVAVDGSMLANPAINNADKPAPKPKVESKLLKQILVYGGIAVATIGIIVGGFFGYRVYANQRAMTTLANAAKSFVEAKGVSRQIIFTESTGEVKVTYDIDTDENMRVLVDGGSYKYSLIKTKAKDSVYLGESATLAPNKIKTFTEFKNFKKTLDLLASDGIDLSRINDVPKLFSADSQKYITVGPGESIDGSPQNKYTYKPTKEMIATFDASLAGGDEKAALLASPESFELTIWVDKATSRITKLSGVSKGSEPDIEPVPDNPEGFVTQSVHSGLNFSFTVTSNYDFNERVKLPIGFKIASSEDAMEFITGNTGGGTSSQAQDAKMKANTHEVQNALEQYFVDNNAYPTAAQSLAVLVPTYLTKADVYAGLTYTLNSSGGYELSFVLANQAETAGDNVKGDPKIYFVTSKQQ